LESTDTAPVRARCSFPRRQRSAICARWAICARSLCRACGYAERGSKFLAECADRGRLLGIIAAIGRIEDEWLRDNLVAIAQLAESLDRDSFELAFRIVPLDWWVTQLPDRPSTAENLQT
jgi:hypothetical protein